MAAPRDTLSFDDRVAAQRAIEQVYWNHRIWPSQNGTIKPALDAVLPRKDLRAKVADYLRKSRALEQFWGRPITANQLQAEMARMASETRDPDTLRELFAALGNDPFLIGETLGRQTLAERMIRNEYSGDRRYGGGETTFDTWWAEEKRLVGTEVAPAAGSLESVTIVPASPCVDNTWTPMYGPPEPSTGQRAIWTGSEMIVWGAGQNAGGRYDPATSTWVRTSSSGAPDIVDFATAVWTGSEMIIWGGHGSDGTQTNAGGRYNPSSDTWVPTTLTSAPDARIFHTAVWTGSEMIVWGGGSTTAAIMGTGGRYRPVTDSWTPTTAAGAPDPRTNHTAIWTGTEMIVWGGAGYDATGPIAFSTGGRFHPATGSWTPTSTAGVSEPRTKHTAVWTGSEMIVWGGVKLPSGTLLFTGDRYRPATDTWTPVSTAAAPSARYLHTAVWTGSEMIVWGGLGSSGAPTNAGGRYNPNSNAWIPTSLTSAPLPRSGHTAVWTGSEMIVWGGRNSSYLNTGGRYDPVTDAWRPTDDFPTARSSPSSVWTGSEMIVWGGSALPLGLLQTGIKYVPATDSWTATSLVGAPDARYLHTAVWTGSEMIVWGGWNGSSDVNTGARYNPLTDSWADLPLLGAPSGRERHTAVWTGSEMIVWGGGTAIGSFFNTGARYNRATDRWIPISSVNAPVPRQDHSAVWTGSQMILWGGAAESGQPGSEGPYTQTGSRYDPLTDSWAATSLFGAPSPRNFHSAVWTGSEMVIWGGQWSFGGRFYVTFGDGGRYNPATDTWTAMSGGQTPRSGHFAVFTGSDMIVWGGINPQANPHPPDGSRYTASSDTWTNLPSLLAPSPRTDFAGAFTGTEMIIWGGEGSGSNFNTGARFCVPTCLAPTTWYQDLDADGYGTSAVTQVSCTWPQGFAALAGDCDDSNPAVHPGVPDVCNGLDDDCDGTVDNGAPCSSGEIVEPFVVEAKLTAPMTSVSWAAMPSAASYDVVAGSLQALRSSNGNFTTSTLQCLQNALPYTSVNVVTNPAPGNGFWYLVRAHSMSDGTGSYDEGVHSQQGVRDAEIDASAGACSPDPPLPASPNDSQKSAE